MNDAAERRGDAPRVASVRPGGAWSGRRQSGREATLRRSPQQLQQVSKARGQHLGRA